MFSSKWFRIGSHVLGWLLFFSLILSFLWVSVETQQDWSQLLTPNHLFFFLLFPAVFYLNEYFLLPKLYLQKKYGAYLLIVALLFMAVFFLKPFDRIMDHRRGNGAQVDHRPPPFLRGAKPPPGFSSDRGGPPFDRRMDRRPNRIDIVSLILFLMTLSISAALRLTRQWRLSEQRAAQAEAERANAELSFLKAQINPHFLFNTLNNIYSLAVTQNDQTPTAIMQLSQMMRYLTDEVRRDFVPLTDEVNCIRNYIDLQRLRLNDKTTIDFVVNGALEGKMVPPLILMTFVENVFKYGISSHESSEITIHISSETETIVFFCQNKIYEAKRDDTRKGVGIENAKKRLEYLYPYKHLLSITTNDKLYTVHLTLKV